MKNISFLYRSESTGPTTIFATSKTVATIIRIITATVPRVPRCQWKQSACHQLPLISLFRVVLSFESTHGGGGGGAEGSVLSQVTHLVAPNLAAAIPCLLRSISQVSTARGVMRKQCSQVFERMMVVMVMVQGMTRGQQRVMVVV